MVTRVFMMILLFYLDAAYPREGTVTATAYSACSTIVMQLIPARGRLRLLLEAAMQVSLMQLSPARGWLHYVEQHIFIDDDAA